MDAYVDLAALGKVLLASLVAGVGLVSVFALGLVGLSERRAAPRDAGHAGDGPGSPGWLVLAALCFLVVLAGVGLGISAIVG